MLCSAAHYQKRNKQTFVVIICVNSIDLLLLLASDSHHFLFCTDDQWVDVEKLVSQLCYCCCFRLYLLFFSRSAPVIYRRRLRLCIVKLHTCVICKIVTFINGSFISLSRGCWFFFLFPTIARSWLLCTFLIVTFWHINFACVCVLFFSLLPRPSALLFMCLLCVSIQ